MTIWVLFGVATEPGGVELLVGAAVVGAAVFGAAVVAAAVVVAAMLVGDVDA